MLRFLFYSLKMAFLIFSKEKLINKGIPFEEYKDERGADKTSRKQRCGDCYRKI